MINSFGTKIFWITLILIPIISFLITFIGTIICKFFPQEDKRNINFYLSPIFGLSFFVLLASVWGRYIFFGGLNFVIFFIILFLILAIRYKQILPEVFRNSLIISLLGIICGVTILIPLFIHGGFNAHNDTFTYLAHSQWLQDHTFDEIIKAENIMPLTTQIALYQTGGFRMGGSFLLALFQSLFRFKWSFDVYPSVIILALTVCCLIIGFTLSKFFPNLRRRFVFLLMSLPALSLGGLVFGANLGFLPQTLGLVFGTGFLIIVGLSLNLIKNTEFNLFSISKLSFLGSLLFSGIVLTYSELTPFIFLAFLISCVYFIIRFFNVKNTIIYSILLALFSIILLNYEIVRAIKALLTQSSAVVGTPVNWPLFGYLSHAFGLHGGAWDISQWSSLVSSEMFIFIFNILFVCIFLFFLIYIITFLIKKHPEDNLLIPILSVTIVFVLFFVYFRYFVSSPFDIGKGQSWSQFKISDWINPFIFVILIFAFVSSKDYIKKYFSYLVVVLFALAFIFSILSSIGRIKPLINTYSQTNDLSNYYVNFNKKVDNYCVNNTPIYLNFNNDNLKFRQIATLYLYNREIKSNWLNDGYIYPWLPSNKRSQWPVIGDCVVELSQKNDFLSNNDGIIIDKFRVGIFQGSLNIGIVDIVGAYGNESDGENYWNWVENNVIYKLRPYIPINPLSKIRLYFEYSTLGDKTLELSFTKDGKVLWSKLINNQGGATMVFDEIINISPDNFHEINIKTDGIAGRLGENDSRLVSFIIRNLRILEYK